MASTPFRMETKRSWVRCFSQRVCWVHSPWKGLHISTRSKFCYSFENLAANYFTALHSAKKMWMNNKSLGLSLWGPFSCSSSHSFANFSFFLIRPFEKRVSIMDQFRDGNIIVFASFLLNCYTYNGFSILQHFLPGKTFLSLTFNFLPISLLTCPNREKISLFKSRKKCPSLSIEENHSPN